ncbi:MULTISPECIES: SAM-dependent methyltransferase [unclassified Devosia]|uniref:class I SAM-dependent methyltransferase n=1 Tax=unclassified Devosia TaxID=196773 RepID=UPI00145DFB0B|nr:MULTISPECIES: SAM-dependent methyltransferase [unclassified Devosia]MBJ6986542.1 SAM-dependent methyltransferase [Devosia sp. MC521]QMW61587.1 SAM-dependent methyltransferase [Devosia sp. MC521]
MSASDRIAEFVAAVRDTFADGTLLKLKLAGYHGASTDLKSVEARKVVIKAGERLSLVYRYKTRDITKNLALAEAEAFLSAGLANDYRSAKLETVAFDLSFERQKDEVRLKRRDVKGREAAPATHDRAKNRPLADTSSVWLKELGITGADGKVLSASQDKFRQINKMVEIFAPLIQQIGATEPTIMDMGAGKGYLDFALADYFKRESLKAKIVGVEMRPALVESGNALAAKSGFASLSFASGMILDFDTSGADAIIALHACDTATDDAIFKGITSGASLIAVAPCCHKQIRRSMEQGQADERLDFLLRHGTFLEKQAEMVTDGLRALILEVHGYRTKVFEFISDAHTPKNNLIVAQKGQAMSREAALDRIASVKAMFGIEKHYLEGLMGL